MLFAIRVDLPFTLAEIMAEARQLAGGVKHETCADLMGLTSQELTHCLALGSDPQGRHLSTQRLAAMTTDPDGKKVFAFFCILLAKRLGVAEIVETAAMVGRALDQLQVTMARAELRERTERKRA